LHGLKKPSTTFGAPNQVKHVNGKRTAPHQGGDYQSTVCEALREKHLCCYDQEPESNRKSIGPKFLSLELVTDCHGKV